jgi:hypothetical protein
MDAADDDEATREQDRERDVHELSAREIVDEYSYLLDDATPVTSIDAETTPELARTTRELAVYLTRTYAMAATERLRELRPVFQFLSAWVERHAVESE